MVTDTVARCRAELKTALAAIDRAVMLVADLRDETGCEWAEIRLVDRHNPDAFFVLCDAEGTDAQIVLSNHGEDQYVAGKAAV